MPKNCWSYPIGGNIGLIPKNDFTQKLATVYEKFKLKAIFFANENELNEYIERPDYNDYY